MHVSLNNITGGGDLPLCVCEMACDKFIVDRKVCCMQCEYVVCSDYRLNMTDIASDVISAPIGDQATSAVWQLSLALVFKMIVTVFTFGIKVHHVIALFYINRTGSG